MHPEDREGLLATIQRLRQPGAGDTWNEEFRALHPVKGERWMVGLGHIERNQSGQAVHFAGINLDLTERKQMEQALRASEEKYRRLHESMTDAFVSVAMDGRITDSNPAYRAMLGYTTKDLSQLTYANLTPEKWHVFEARLVAEQILPHGHSEVYEKEYRRKDGTVFPVELRTFLLHDASEQPAGMWAIVRDITERKRAEQALREAHDLLEARVRERTADLQAANLALQESEERYRSLVSNLNVGVFRTQPGSQGRFLHANPALAQMFGYSSPEELLQLGVPELYHEPGEREVFLAELRRRETLLSHELRLKRKNGTPVYCSMNASAHRSSDGEIDWIDGVIEDITQRKQVEQSLVESLDQNHRMLAASPMGIAALKASGECVFTNQALARIVGGTIPELLQWNFRQMRSWRETGLLQLAKSTLAKSEPSETEIQAVTSFGKEVWLDFHMASFSRGGEAHLLCMYYEISDR
ncbi:MAG: PAS domain S-box protein, partial [Verrucomicrobia bacterium]|nr:PAS domain S-box protein [Verrucomicrobiota bacterium]